MVRQIYSFLMAVVLSYFFCYFSSREEQGRPSLADYSEKAIAFFNFLLRHIYSENMETAQSQRL